MKTIGVISDTHGLVRPEALDVLAGCDPILHAGDLGSPHVLERLGDLGRVVAVRGNVDTDRWADRLPRNEVVEIEGVSIYLLHDLDQLDLDPRAAGFSVVVYGHSHRPDARLRHDVLYLNPGSAGPRRFRLPVSVARLVLGDGAPRAEIVELTV